MPSLAKILLPVDFSGRCRGGARYVEALGARFGSEITLLHVLPPPHHHDARIAHRHVPHRHHERHEGPAPPDHRERPIDGDPRDAVRVGVEHLAERADAVVPPGEVAVQQVAVYQVGGVGSEPFPIPEWIRKGRECNSGRGQPAGHSPAASLRAMSAATAR